MKSRRIDRKNARKEKKQKRHSHYLKKKYDININISDNCEQLSDVKTLTKNRQNNDKKEKEVKEMKTNLKVKNKETNIPKMTFIQKKEIEKEEREIKRLEKKLKLNRRRKKKNTNEKTVTSLPKSFKTEGLDYILEVIDSYKQQESNDELDLNDKKSHKISNDNILSDESDISEESDDEDNEDEYSDNEEEEEDTDNDLVSNVSDDLISEINSDNELQSEEIQVMTKLKKKTKKKNDNELKEDIYGFLRDSKGNIIKPEKSVKKTIENSCVSIDNQLMRQMRGALNRLTVNNVLTISSQIKDFYQQFSRHDVNEALVLCIKSSIIDLEYNSSQKLTTEISILVSILYFLSGDEVGGHVIHSLIVKFDELFHQINTNDTKIMDNLLLLISNLYLCGLIDSLLIYEIMMKLCDNFNEKCIELINQILKAIGFTLRKDNAIKMKELILQIQNLAKNVDKSSLSGHRIEFLLESLIAIKNNNMTKFRGYGTVVDLQLIENTLKSTIKKIRVNNIIGTYDAILQSSHWYSYTINFESTNSLNNNKKQTNFLDNNKSVSNELNDRLVRALRLNTPLRKTIVMCLTSANDFIDATHRLISTTKKQFSEVTNVLIHISIHEKHFNPFYSHLLQHLGKCDRKYKLALDFAIRDKISELQSLQTNQQFVLSQLVLDLLKLNALSITCLKVVHFTDMNETLVLFMKNILLPILESEELIQQILSKIANKDSFATAIRLFIDCFIDQKYRTKLDLKRFQIKLS
ncbi:nucleolar MIF4G domain-containing protein 1-like [Oppia nitens]|uniref:nucleolar MIF4G domain-containing protein 1-like n=1 Tax=Oppia nitens TaxID=1686743 RepID=UPI0023DA4A4D|nr:nucleolar MIF4G domain-containing protein 1-like [Oppia nitens]